MSRYLITNSKMYDIVQNQRTYDKFLEFKKSFFEKGVSFFDNSIKLFDDDEVFNEFEKRIITNYDASKNDSLDKYQKQLKNSSKKMRHFFANLIWLYNYPIYSSTKKSTTKTNEIKIYLDEYYSDNLINTTIDYEGIASWGMLSHQKYENINLIYFFTKEYIKTKNNANTILNNLNLYELMSNLSDEKFKKITSLASRHILNYLFNPDEYEPIVDTGCKKSIAKYFNKQFNKQTLDKILLEIREEGFGFNNSLYDVVCGEQSLSNTNTAKAKEITFNEDKDFNLKLTSNFFDKDEYFKKEETKITNGENAELLVYESIKNSVDLKILCREINKLFDENKTIEIHSKMYELIHYSKNFNAFAPFDLITTKGEEIIFIEVKSTTSNEIYFSANEVKFAYDNIDNYQIKVVKENEIYNLNLDDIIVEVYNCLQNISYKWSLDNIKIKLDFST